MNIAGNIQVTHRLNPAASGGRPRWSNLAIGKDPSSGELYLSCHSNVASSKYKILGNIEKVFLKFIVQGLATIRFREPAHDLSINCKENVEGLKSFLITLRQVLYKKPIAVPLLSLNPTGPIVQKAKTSLTITDRSAYPVLSGFPNTLEALSLNLQMERFDRRIIRLINLKTLDLSDNRISELPEELGELPCLATVILSGNRLGKATDQESIWSWMESPHMALNLRQLDLASNELQQLPAGFSNLRSLVVLKLDGNLLTSLPHVISTFSQLKYLGAGGNKLMHLPGSLTRLSLDYLDISGNSFVSNIMDPALPNEDALSNPPSLFEEAARTILNKRILYPRRLIPKILKKYLNNAKICCCGSSCFESCATIISTISLLKISPLVISDGKLSIERVPAEMHFCSKKCFTFTWLKGALFKLQYRTVSGAHRGPQRRNEPQMAQPRLSRRQRTERDDIVTPWMNEFIEQYKSK